MGLRRGPAGEQGHLADAATTIESLKERVKTFADERRWEPYHSPKNVAMALACEAAELMEPYRWLDCDESRGFTDDPANRQAVADELADVTILILNMSLSTGIDVSEAVLQKLVKNAEKYPAPQSTPRDRGDDRATGVAIDGLCRRRLGGGQHAAPRPDAP